MAQQGLKIGQEGLKVVILTKQKSCFFFFKKVIFFSSVGLGASEIVWSLPAVLLCYRGLYHWDWMLDRFKSDGIHLLLILWSKNILMGLGGPPTIANFLPLSLVKSSVVMTQKLPKNIFLGQEMHTKNAQTTFSKTFYCSLIHVSSKGSMLLLILIYENQYFLEI